MCTSTAHIDLIFVLELLNPFKLCQIIRNIGMQKLKNY